MFHLILDDTLQELTVHGTHLFPFAIYLGGGNQFEQGYMDWHWHKSFEVNILTSGSLHYYIENQDFIMQAGEAVFINSGRLHMGRPLTDDQYSKTLVFHYRLFCEDEQSDWFQTVLQPFIQTAAGGLKLSPQIPWQKQVLEELLAACDAYEAADTGYELAAKGHICTAFSLLLANIPHSSSAVSETGRNQRIRCLLSYIRQNYMNPITLADLAALVNLSESECSRFFTSQIHESPFTYLTHYRIERSCDLLIHTDTSISDIAIQVGFNSFSYYSKRFREVMHCSPSEYRTQIRDATSR